MPAAVNPSKKAKCPPCFVVANTIFVFALLKTDVEHALNYVEKSDERKKTISGILKETPPAFIPRNGFPSTNWIIQSTYTE